MSEFDSKTASSRQTYPVTESNRVKRIAERASYDEATIHSIIDSSYLCHVGFMQNARPVVIPMAHWRIGGYLYLHSAKKGRFAKICVDNDIAVSIATFDGIALGHSAFNHSYNYRSVVVQGRCEVVNDPEQKKFAMRAFVDHVVAGRWETLRPVTDSEMRAVVVMRIRLSTVSAKARDEFPDKETDNPDWPVWVGVIPARLAFGAPEADPVRNKVSPAPEQVREYAGIDRFTPTYRFKTNSPADEGD